MIAFERRQLILRLLYEQPGMTVPMLAKELAVSEGTIRNDLDALEGEQKVQRVRGGAILIGPPPPVGAPLGNGAGAQGAGNGQGPRSGDAGRGSRGAAPRGLPAKMEVSAQAKKRIARWASNLVERGETILLDASTTVLHMGPYLQEHQQLTIVTNGVEIARQLAANPSNTVILLGGILNREGGAITSTLGAGMLNELHIRTAFVSGVGFDVEAGLTEMSLQEAPLKRLMLQAATRVVVLADASKLGKIGLTAVARPEQITHLFIDSDVDAETVAALRGQPFDLTICGENTITTYTSQRHQPAFKLGFANLSEEIPFAVDVRRGLERSAKQMSNIDLVLADNSLSAERALAIADNFIAKQIHLAIEYQIDAQVGSQLMNKYQRAGIPVIAVDIPLVGATYFGVDNFHSGHLAGTALGQWVQAQWEGQIDRLFVLEEPRAGALPAARILGQLAGLQEVVGLLSEEQRVVLNSGNTSSVSQAEVERALRELPHLHRIAVICFNDDAAIGALRAAQRLQREGDLAIVGQGADRIIRDELRRPGSRIIGSTAFMPERYGEKLADLALRILRGESAPPAEFMDHVFLSAENVHIYYP
jgi:ribose transport system substrate-binding protein